MKIEKSENLPPIKAFEGMLLSSLVSIESMAKPYDSMLGNAKPMKPIIKQLGAADYAQTLLAMQTHNRTRTADTPDEIWLLEHLPVYTLGLAGKSEHVLNAGNIPVIKVERGGQVTYHGPGQLVAYLLLDVKRLGYGVKELVRRIEQSLIDLLAQYEIESFCKTGMPGVYVNLSASDAKIAAIGLRVANHATYHGLSLNVDMDLEPFSRINPCGYKGLAVTQMHDLRGVGKIETDKIDADDINAGDINAGDINAGDINAGDINAIGEKLVAHLQRNLNVTNKLLELS